MNSIDLGNCRRTQSWPFSEENRSSLLELALRNVAAEHSDKPMYFVFPCFRISSRAGIDSSRGVSARDELVGITYGIEGLHTRINSMQVVEIRCESEALDGSIDICLDVGGRVGDTANPKDIETALRSD